jgi:phosphate transport system substrate-binding protein
MERTITPTSPIPLECQQYPPDQAEWPKEYNTNSYIKLSDLYQQYYGQIRDNNDLYALAYYNNRKALETGLYQFINPAKLSLGDGKVFLPHISWINIYKEFSPPVLGLEDFGLFNGDITIDISGSSALYPLSRQIIGCINKPAPFFDVQIEQGNTLSGLSDFCQGRVDMFSTSEQITSEIISENGCLDANLISFVVAKYAVVIFINNDNPYANEIAKEPLKNDELIRLVFLGKSWDDVRTNWGKEPITRYFPHEESGTFEIVKNEIFPNLDTNVEIANPKGFEGNNSIPLLVANDKYSIGVSGFADYQRKGNLIAIPIENVLPNLETIKEDKYPLTRYLYLYTGKNTFDENPPLRFFINYYLTYELDFLERLGYFFPEKADILTNQYYPKSIK